MKNALITLTLCLIISGCSDNSASDRLRGELEVCRKTNTELLAENEKLSAVAANSRSKSLQTGQDGSRDTNPDLTTKESQKVDSLGVLLIDTVVNETMVVDFVVDNLNILQFEKRVIGAEPYWDAEPLINMQKNAVMGVGTAALSDSQLNTLISDLYVRIQAIFNDKDRLARYYNTFKQPVVRAVVAYQRQKFGDYFSATEFLEKVRQGFVDLLAPEKFKAVENYVRAEEELNNLDWKSLDDVRQQAAREERLRLEDQLHDLSPALFAYRRFVQSGRDRELIELYVRLFDDFLATAKDEVKRMTKEEQQKLGLVLVTPGSYSRGNQVILDPYDWFALYQTDNGLVLKKTDLSITPDINALSDEQIRVISAPGNKEPLLLLKGADWLVEGPVDSLLGSTYLSNELLSKTPYTVLDQIDVLKIEIVKPSGGKEAQDVMDNPLEPDSIALQVRSKGAVQKIGHYYNPRYTFFQVNWVGDLDRDGKPDFMTTASIEGKAYAFRYLYLSGAAKGGELFKEFVPTDPDGGGC